MPSLARDKSVLEGFYHHTDGENWTVATNWLTDNPLNTWHGVSTNSSGRVTGVDLRDNGISGHIPADLGNLTELKRLHLSSNRLVGEIPAKLGLLENLVRLDLSDNALEGEIPPELGDLTELSWLDLENNALSGGIPAELGDLSGLSWLNFRFNRLSGEIPAELGDLSELSWLDLGFNRLSGEIPSKFGNLSGLLRLLLESNELSGEIPAELRKLLELERLTLSDNRLEGSVPAELGDLTQLKLFTLHNNDRLMGQLPDTLAKISGVRRFTFHATGLCVPIGGSLQEWFLKIRDRTGTVCRSVGTVVATEEVDVIIRDIFGRVVNETGIVVVDWEGHIANPAMKYFIELPSRSANLSANEPRLYFDLRSSVGAKGPSKLLVTQDPTQPIEFRISIFPDRDTLDEQHVLTIRYDDGRGLVRSQTVDVHVIDQDLDRPLEFNVITDFSHDETGFFDDPAAREAIRQAADDFAYFIADMNLDEVRAGDESMWINESGDPNNPRDWGVGEWVSNRVAYTGFWLGVYGNYRNEGAAGGGGQPSSSGRNQSARGREYPIKRSGIVDINPKGNYNALGWITAVDDDDWWQARNYGDVPNDLYSIALHEIGHALVFNPGHDGFSGFKDALEVRAPALKAYYGSDPRLDRYDHLFDSIDPTSRRGAFGNEYGGEMVGGRWLMTKFDLLVAQAIGYVLRDTSPFRELSLADEPLSEGRVGDEYVHTMDVVGGIPTYFWSIDSGELPEGLSLNSFTGTISGTPTEFGTFGFTIRLRDQTEGHPGVTRDVTLIVRD